MSDLEYLDETQPNKRFKASNQFFLHSSHSPDSIGHVKVCPNRPEAYFLDDERRPLEARDRQSTECAVTSNESVRHLFSPPSPVYTAAAAAIAVSSDNELLTNGDSGFQELNAEDRVSETNSVKTPGSMDESANDNGSNDSNAFEGEEDDEDLSLSGFSDISDMSSENWRPVPDHMDWVNRQIESGQDPKEILQHLTGKTLPETINDLGAWRIILRMLSEPVTRPKLNYVNTIDDAINLIRASSKIIVLTGAGVSVSCGIPDFRSRNGIYARLSKDYPDLPDPQSMFDIHYFRRNPCPFFKFAKEIYPGQFAPSASHKFIKYIEKKGKLLRNYSQNIDTLEKAADIERVITCHGSFATATCMTCGLKVDSNAIKDDIFAQRIPLCVKCTASNETDDTSVLPVMKPDIVFFGEGLSEDFHYSMTEDKDECDLLIVIGSSLKVKPVALIPSAIPEHVPQILINREPLAHLNFDVELLGDCDVIIKHLCQRLGRDWHHFCFFNDSNQKRKLEAEDVKSDLNREYDFREPCRYVFAGAELDYSNASDSDCDSDCEGGGPGSAVETAKEDDDNCSNDLINNLLPSKDFTIDSQCLENVSHMPNDSQ